MASPWRGHIPAPVRGYHAAMVEPRFAGLTNLLACPQCRGPLGEATGGLECEACPATYSVIEGIPVFAEEHATVHDELDHLASGDSLKSRDRHKAHQAAWFDRDQQAEFEIERPNGTPRFYRFLLLEKFRRAIHPVGRLTGRTALAVCGGSGMDAELLARRGALAISSDISLGAAKRAQERARRHGVPLLSIVADVEHLPFRDQSMDLVYVHDGLHHLADPERGLQEMARVARRWVSLSEPARATATRLAVKLGMALDREEAGNAVVRFDPGIVRRQLRSAGFDVVRSERYAMYYRHVPGRIFEALSRPGLYRLSVAAWRLANLALGRIGNKLAVVAERSDDRTPLRGPHRAT